MMAISYEEFEKVDLRSGTIIKADYFPRTKKPAYKVWVDFGDEIGIKQTSAQITIHYTPESLISKQVLGCINLGEKNSNSALNRLGRRIKNKYFYFIIWRKVQNWQKSNAMH